MAERIQLNENELEDVVGGAFIYNTYTNDDGSSYMTCRVEGDSTYYCTADAKDKISVFILTERPTSLQQIVNYAKDNGLFW